MSQQFGMQMPGGRQSAAPSLDLFTGLLFLAFVVLLLATVFVYLQGSKIGPDGKAYEIHGDGPLQLPAS